MTSEDIKTQVEEILNRHLTWASKLEMEACEDQILKLIQQEKIEELERFKKKVYHPWGITGRRIIYASEIEDRISELRGKND